MELSEYELLKTLHIISIGLLMAVLCMGMLISVVYRYVPTMTETQQKAIGKLRLKTSWAMLLLAGVFIPGTGLRMTQIAQFDLQELWLLVGNSITLIIALAAYGEIRCYTKHTGLGKSCWVMKGHGLLLLAMFVVVGFMVLKTALD